MTHWRIIRFRQSVGVLTNLIRRLFWNFRSRKFPRDSQGQFLLHIGCGDIDSPEFVNIDARPRPHIHIVTTSLFKLSEIPDGVASLIYMCHVLEHVQYRQVSRVLREMRRMLAPGGVLRVSVPDFALIVQAFEASGRDADAIAGPLLGGQDYEFNFHYSVFSERNLSSAMKRAGFGEIRVWDPRNCANHDFDDWSTGSFEINGLSYPISLNLEASAFCEHHEGAV